MKILLVEDDSDLAAALGWSLKSEGFDTKRADCLEAAKQLLNDEAPDLVLLDVMLPDGEGYEFCEYIRNRDAQLPVIFLTALDGEKEVVKAFGAGADDYVTKPFRMAELVARIRSKLRLRQRHGDLNIDANRLCLWNKDERIDLSPNEYRLLKLFTEHGGVISREQIMKSIFDTDEYADPNTASVYVKRLRDKLKQVYGHDPIQTVRGEGYRWEEAE